MKALLNQSEKDIQNTILKYLDKKGYFAWPQNTVGLYDAKKQVFRKPMSKANVTGISDILGIMYDSGKFLAIEVKRPAEFRRIMNNIDEYRAYVGEDKNICRYQKQIQFIDKINANGGVAFFASSIEDVEIGLSL